MATTGTADIAIEEVAVQDVGTEVFVSGLGNVTATSGLARSSSAVAKKIRFTGLHFTTPTPAVVMLQPRQSDNQDNNFPDQFAVQVISTTATTILCLITRLDQATGWGQDLRIDIWAVDEVRNP